MQQATRGIDPSKKITHTHTPAPEPRTPDRRPTLHHAATERKNNIGKRKRKERKKERNQRKEVYAPGKPHLYSTGKKGKKNRNKRNRRLIKLIHAVLVRTLRGHGRRRDAGGSSDIIHVAHQGLRVEAEGFAHQTSDTTSTVLVSSHLPINGCRKRTTYPQTTTSSNMEPHRRATRELSCVTYVSSRSLSNSWRTRLYMTSSSSVAGSSSCSRR